jgi:branched-chain amino acid aminotransferase/para-aminobenzoate synthetase component 1
LGKHKTLNYLYYLTARQAALDSGGDEALILDTMGNAADTAAGSLMVKIDGQWFRPASPQRLRGITVELVTELFKREGRKVHEQPLTMDDLLSAETVWVLNSLMGVMPVSSIDDHSLPVLYSEEAARVREALLEDRSTHHLGGIM